ncbi:MAG: hypothetical protein ACMXYC_01545 [Candidatus Woesearchaeota archaeon]
MSKRRKSHKKESYEALCARDLELLLEESSGFTDDMHRLIAIQSCTGHAHEGHVSFKGRKIPNMTPDWFGFLALGPDGLEIFKQEREKYLSDWEIFTLKLAKQYKDRCDGLNSANPIGTYTWQGKPMFGKKKIDCQPIKDVASYLIGCIWASHLDSDIAREDLNERVFNKLYDFHKKRQKKNDAEPEKRTLPKDPIANRVAKKFSIPLRRGTTYPIDMDKLREHGLTLFDLANSNSPKRIEFLAKHNAIDDHGEVMQEEFISLLHELSIAYNYPIRTTRQHYPSLKGGGIVTGYIEITPGRGMSDDKAYLNSYLIGGPNPMRAESTACGFDLGDAADTIDKCLETIEPNGRDGKIGESIYRILKTDLINRDTIMAWMYLSVKFGIHDPSSSQRYFEQQHHDGVTTLQHYDMLASHILSGCFNKFTYPDIKLDFPKIPFSMFTKSYQQFIRDCYEEIEHLDLFPHAILPRYKEFND